MAGLQCNMPEIDQKKVYCYLLACNEAVEAKLVKLETSHKVILPPARVGVL